MRSSGRTIARTTTWLAAIAALAVGLGIPVLYWTLSYLYNTAALSTEAEINSRIVTQIINANPELWKYEQIRLETVLGRRPASGVEESRQILDPNSVVIAESVQELDPPRYSRSAPLLDSGTVVGSLRITRSLRPILVRTSLLALLGSVLGGFIFYTLRIYPFQSLQTALDALLREKEQAEITLGAIGDGVITTNARHGVLFMNAAAERLTGWSLNEARGKNVFELLKFTDEETRQPRNPVAMFLPDAGAASVPNQALLINRAGTERIVSCMGGPIHDRGSVAGTVLVLRDVTEKEKLDAEMEKAGKLESLGVLAGGIAHDFNNVLTVILGNVSLAKLISEGPEKVNEYLDNAEKACFRARGLTGQLLTFSRGGMPVKESVSLAELIRESAKFALTGSSVRSNFRISGNLPPIMVDSSQMNQVVHNLIINAVEAMPYGGVITVSAEPCQVGPGDIKALPEGHYVRVSIEDQGTGIRPELLPRIFDPYFSTKPAGTGLGLAICYSIVKKHGGHILVDSVLGRGTTFRFYLPASSVAQPADTGQAPQAAVPGKGKILVMDDEEPVRSSAYAMLAQLGYQSMLVPDGSAAVEAYKAAREAGAPFDAVILDVTVPGGKGGIETLKEILALDPGARALVSSGYAESPVMAEFNRFGFQGVIAKPYDIARMSSVLNTVLRSSAS